MSASDALMACRILRERIAVRALAALDPVTRATITDALRQARADHPSVTDNADRLLQAVHLQATVAGSVRDVDAVMQALGWQAKRTR